MEIILNFMYTDELEMTCQDIVDIYTAAQKLRMMKIIVKCIQVKYLSLMKVASRYNTSAGYKKNTMHRLHPKAVYRDRIFGYHCTICTERESLL